MVDKPILDMLNIAEETEVSITTDGVRLIVSPIPSDRPDDKAFLWASELASQTHRETLDKLAKT